MEHVTNMNKAANEMIEVLTRVASKDITNMSTDEFEMTKALINMMKAYNGMLEEMYMKLDYIEDMVQRQ